MYGVAEIINYDELFQSQTYHSLMPSTYYNIAMKSGMLFFFKSLPSKLLIERLIFEIETSFNQLVPCRVS